VRFLRTYFSADRRRMLCVYDAPDAESVRAAQQTIAMPVERVWPAQVLG
jgi:Nickel responsive protein SCO4226-like